MVATMNGGVEYHEAPPARARAKGQIESIQEALPQSPPLARPEGRYLVECPQRERDAEARGVMMGRERSGYGSRAVGRDHYRRGA